jgi:hypothetical protein
MRPRSRSSSMRARIIAKSSAAQGHVFPDSCRQAWAPSTKHYTSPMRHRPLSARRETWGGLSVTIFAATEGTAGNRGN